MYYNNLYNPGIIEISTANAFSGTTYNSYIIEVWYFPDNLFEPTVILKAPSTEPINQKNHIFYTNIVELFIDASSSNDYYSHFINATANVNLSANFSKLEWNRILLQVKYDPTITPNSHTCHLFTKNKLLGTNKVVLGTSSTALTLTKIVFTHNDQTGRYPNIFWGSGYYRNLKVWDGNQSSPWNIIQYNE